MSLLAVTTVAFYSSVMILQASIVAVLQSDLAKIESLVEEAVRQLSSAASSSSVRPLDACEVMEAMNRHHLGELLPRIEDADKAFEQLCNHCVDCKVGDAHSMCMAACTAHREHHVMSTGLAACGQREHSQLEMRRKAYAVRRRDKSLCTQKQPEHMSLHLPA